jgi:hypothetical protein
VSYRSVPEHYVGRPDRWDYQYFFWFAIYDGERRLFRTETCQEADQLLWNLREKERKGLFAVRVREPV